MLFYRGYTGMVEVDEDTGELFGVVADLRRDIVTFCGWSWDELFECFVRSVDFYLERCAATGKTPDRPGPPRGAPAARPGG